MDKSTMWPRKNPRLAVERNLAVPNSVSRLVLKDILGNDKDQCRKREMYSQVGDMKEESAEQSGRAYHYHVGAL